MSAQVPACQHHTDLSTQFDSESLSVPSAYQLHFHPTVTTMGNRTQEECLISCLAGPRAARPSLQLCK
eukprot:15331105-Alexandrium_andersonii.AAC.1